MAWTKKYVSSSGTEAWATNSEGNPSSLTEAAANAVAGEKVIIKADGTYSEGADLTFAGGSWGSQIWLSGCNTAEDDLSLAFNADGSLDTTGFPVISLGNFTLAPAAANILSFLNITGSDTAHQVGSAANDGWTLYGCKVVSTRDSTANYAVRADNYCSLYFCDIECTGARNSYVMNADQDFTVFGCRVLSKGATSSNGCISANGAHLKVIDTVCGMTTGTRGIIIDAEGVMPTIQNCSFYGMTDAIVLPNAAQIGCVTVANCVAYNYTTWINNLYSATASKGLHELHNALEASPTRTGIDNSWVEGEITLTADPFVDAANWDFTLNNAAGGGALCRAAGLRAFRDLGAFQTEGGGGGVRLVGPGGIISPL